MRCDRLQSIIKSFLIIASVALIDLPVNANTIPPTPTNQFYGDANGDSALSGADLITYNNQILGKPAIFDTLQPAGATTVWNTCDLNSDRACTGADLLLATNMVLGKPASIGARPWILENSNLPTSGNPFGVWIPFKANLKSTHVSVGESGRPGISVIAEIDPSSPGTGSLAGRECNPNPSLGRDQYAGIGAQCALSVTVTDWAGTPGPAAGLTESGSTGLSILGNGDGDLILKLHTEAVSNLDIPAASIRVTVAFMSPDQIDITCPASKSETLPIACAVATSSGFQPCEIGPNDTCGGSIDSACVGPYTAPAQGEAKGPGSCVAHVVKGSASDQHTIIVNEANQPPSCTLYNVSASCMFGVTGNVFVSDPDLPPQTLTCGISTTCSPFPSISGCNNFYVGLEGGNPCPFSCSVTVTVMDPYSSTQCVSFITLY